MLRCVSDQVGERKMAMSTQTRDPDAEAATTTAQTPDARASFEDSRHIRQVALAWDPVADEMKTRVEGDGIHALGVDAAHVLMGELHVKPEGLEGYHVTRPGEALLDTDRLLQHAKSFSLGDRASLRFDGEAEEIHAEQGRVSRQAPYLDGVESVKTPKVPMLTLPGKATVPDIGELFDFVKHVTKETSDHVRVTVSNVDGLTVRAHGDSTTDVYHAPVDEIDLPMGFSVGAEDSVSSRFSGDYLSSLLKVAKKMDTGTTARVRLHVGEDFPLRFVVENTPLKATYTLAPRIGDD